MTTELDGRLSALQRARGKGLSLKQLSGQLHLGKSHQQELRRALAQLLKEGRARFDGHVYQAVAQQQREQKPEREEVKVPSRRVPAALAEGARARRAQQKGAGPAPATKAGTQVTGVIH